MINKLLASPCLLKLGVGFQGDVIKMCKDYRHIAFEPSIGVVQGGGDRGIVPVVEPFCDIHSLFKAGANRNVVFEKKSMMMRLR